jgi:hypothetical protein
VATGPRIFAVAMLLLGLALGPGAAVAEKKEEATPKGAANSSANPTAFKTWYASSLGRNESGMVVVNYWSKGPKLRAEVIVKGYRLTTVVDATHYHIFNPVIGSGVSIERSEKSIAGDADRGRPFANEFESLTSRGAEVIDEQTMEGTDFKFLLYQLTDKTGRRQLLVTDAEPHLPVRVESFIRSTGENTVLEYSGWNRGLPIADSFFVIPSAVKFEQVTYQQYLERSRKGPVGPAPVFYGNLLHGQRE